MSNATRLRQVITDRTKELIEDLRQYSVSQKDTWQRVPYLALMADGRTGFSDAYGQAYYHGYWQLHETQSGGYYHAVVDCATGELLNSFDPNKKASDEALLPLLLEPDALDAQSIVDHLTEEAEEPIGSYYPPDHGDTLASRAKEIQEDYGVHEMYVRTRPHAKHDWGADL